MDAFGLRSDLLVRNRHLSVLLGVSLGALPVLAYAIASYRAWYNLGPGGVPHNMLGWLVNVFMRPLARSDTRAVAPYTMESQRALYGAAGGQSFFFFDDDDGGEYGLPAPRVGARPDVPSFVVPQRQTSDCAPAALRARQAAFMRALAAANPAAFVLRPSGLEHPDHEALFLAGEAQLPPALRRTRGEFLHVHGEGSAHAVFSLADAARLIERGWAERHRLTGVRGFWPWSYVMLYAPRDDAEFAPWASAVVAAARFSAAAAGVRDIRTP